MKEIHERKEYKSPKTKLVIFFEKSRNKWKAKFSEAKKIIKFMQNRVHFLEKSKEKWKSRVKELESEISLMKKKEQILEKELEDSKKKTPDNVSQIEHIEDFKITPYHHKYSVGHMFLFISLVLTASTSFRSASHSLKIVGNYLQIPLSCPSWFSGRLWLLRLGYYKLMMPKTISEDWVWIIDHTIQAGVEKSLVILGIRLSCVPSERSLKHEDLEPIALIPVKKSNGDIIYQQLEDTIPKTGIPRQIIGDHGSDLKKGIKKFCDKHSETIYTYDIKHKTASVLKYELEKDEDWLKFASLAGETKKKVQQTQLSFLSPPNQRTKARYMNIDTLIKWGQDTICFFDKNQKNKSEYPQVDEKQLVEKIGWIVDFRNQIKEWSELIELINITENFVRNEGLYREAYKELKKRLVNIAQTKRTQKVRAKLISFVIKESFKGEPDERLVGSSEVLESVFGKLKYLEQDQSKSGFTGLILSIPAMVSKTTGEIIKKAMEIVPTKTILDWCKTMLGKSVQAKRKEAYKSKNNAEQKSDQLIFAT